MNSWKVEMLVRAATLAWQHLEFSGRRRDIQKVLAEAIKDVSGAFPVSIRKEQKLCNGMKSYCQP